MTPNQSMWQLFREPWVHKGVIVPSGADEPPKSRAGIVPARPPMPYPAENWNSNDGRGHKGHRGGKKAFMARMRKPRRPAVVRLAIRAFLKHHNTITAAQLTPAFKYQQVKDSLSQMAIEGELSLIKPSRLGSPKNGGTAAVYGCRNE